MSLLVSSSWRSCTLVFGVAHLTSTGLFLQRTVCYTTAQLNQTNGYSSMFCCDEPSHHQRRHQHYIRHYDHSHPNANLSQVAAPIEAQGCPHWRLRIGCLHCKLHLTLTHLKPKLTRTDPLRHPQQVLQFQRTLRLKLDVLVHPRILHRHHNRQPSLHLDPPPPHLQARLIQRLDIRQEHKQPLQSIPLKLHQPSLRRALPSPRGA